MIRYRGYYFDTETGFYFLNARYYSPAWRRFISPDDTFYLAPETPNRLNLYAYCNNDHVNYVDPSGNSIIAICVFIGLSTVIGAAAIGGFFTDISVQAVSHSLSGSGDSFSVDWGRAGKTAFMTGIAGAVPTFVDPTKTVLNAMAGATVGMDASFINAVVDVLFTKLL